MKRPVILSSGRYTIRAMALPTGWAATAHLQGGRPGTGPIDRVDGRTQDEVVGALHDRLADRARRLKAARRHDADMGFDVPSESEYREALGVVGLSRSQMAMLTAHAKAGDAGLSATDLSRAGGFRGYEAANMHYGKAGRTLAERLDITPPVSRIRGHDLWTGTLAAWHPTSDDPDIGGLWIMYPELCKAVGALQV